MLGDLNIFMWKSKSQQQREEEEYEKWAFPYGQTQREKLVRLMLEVFPKESEATTLIPFLTCKELYSNYMKTSDSSDQAVEKLINLKKYKRILTKKNMALYLALVLADAQIDESLDYPTAGAILEMAKGLAVTKA